MTLSEYLIEAVAKRTSGKYSLKPEKMPIMDWLDRNGFKQVERPAIGETVNLKSKDRIYFLGPNTIYGSNWIAMHSKNVYELIMWFDENDNVSEIEYRINEGRCIKYMTFDEATKILASMLK
jgi:hypothetical protein